ncbi:MAG: GntR family transcriptional regulator [Roseiarcus sp.]
MTIVAAVPRGRLYENVADTLRQEIERGRFARSQGLPGERALCELLDVSRTT